MEWSLGLLWLLCCGAILQHSLAAHVGALDGATVGEHQADAAAHGRAKQAPCLSNEACKALSGLVGNAEKAVAMQAAVSSPMAQVTACSCTDPGEGCGEKDADKEDEEEEKRLDDQEDAIKAAGAVKCPDAAEAPVTTPAPPSALEKRATKYLEAADKFTKESKDSEEQLKVMKKIDAFKKMKAKRLAEKAMASYKRAGEEAAEVAKAKVAMASVAMRAAACAQADVNKANQGSYDRDQQKAAEIKRKMDKMKREAQAAEAKARDMAAKKGEQAGLASAARAKAEMESKAATTAAQRIALNAQEAMAKFKEMGSDCNDAHAIVNEIGSSGFGAGYGSGAGGSGSR
jgi:hypothetical protein